MYLDLHLLIFHFKLEMIQQLLLLSLTLFKVLSIVKYLSAFVLLLCLTRRSRQYLRFFLLCMILRIEVFALIWVLIIIKLLLRVLILMSHVFFVTHGLTVVVAKALPSLLLHSV